MNKSDLARQVIEALPFSRALSMELVRIGDGEAVMSMPWNERLVGDPGSGVIHGGAVSALMDTCCGAAVMSRSDGTGITATLDLRIDYMRPARSGHTIRAEAHCYHATRTVAFVRATATDGTDGSPVVSAVGSFTFQRNEAAK